MAEPFDTAKDVVSRQRLAIIESASVPGQPAHAVCNPDGTNISAGGGGGGNVNIHDATGAAINNGQQTMANSVPVVIASNQSAIPISDSAGAAITVGQKPMAMSVPVVIANNQSPIPVTISGASTSLTPTSNQRNVLAGPTQNNLSGVPMQVDQVHIIANLTNTGNIFLGATGVNSANGLILEPGRGATLEEADLNTIFINGTAGDGVSYFALT